MHDFRFHEELARHCDNEQLLGTLRPLKRRMLRYELAPLAIDSSDARFGQRIELRQKLRAGSPQWNYIHTHFGVGYRFAPESENSVEEELDLITGVHVTETPDAASHLDAADRLNSALAG